MPELNMAAESILIVDDDEVILQTLAAILRREGYTSTFARNGREALDEIAKKRPSLVFLDISMPEMDGFEALRRLKGSAADVPVVIMTGQGTMATAIKAMQLGAFDYVLKPLDIEQISTVARKALESSGSLTLLSPEVTEEGDADRYTLIGDSPRMQEVYKLIGSLSRTPNTTPVLILGETGTGKELVARAIHQHGGNHRDPFVPINCTALPETLLESELFGHEKGAFTGATDRKLGKFEMAGAGTIFLDEIGDLPSPLQMKLLRVLQEREFERLGGHERIPIHARFVAATNQNLRQLIGEGKFREDLYYRLNVAVISLPPLRERREDIPVLVRRLVTKYNFQIKKSVRVISTEAMEILQSYDYPGNVRELENLVERGVMLARNETLAIEEISELLGQHAPPAESAGEMDFARAREEALSAFERGFLLAQLERHQGNLSSLSQAHKIPRPTLYRLLSKHGIDPGRFRKSSA
jgi:two-component system, NtrC family, response regulator AtoC